MGAPDPRRNAFGDIDFRLTRQWGSYKREDTPAKRVKPIPILIITYILNQAHGLHRDPARQAIADITTIAFYFLLRPGEYTGTTTDDAPFLLAHIGLYHHNQRLDLLHSPMALLHAATSASYTFTKQKNGVENEKLVHGRSGHPLCCPVLATVRLVLHPRAHKATLKTPIASYYTARGHFLIRAPDVTNVLRNAVAVNQTLVGISPTEVSAKSLRAGGAMALLCARVDTNLIKLLGRWHSDTMMRYLHVQAVPIMRPLAPRMFNNGRHTFLPYELVPILDPG